MFVCNVSAIALALYETAYVIDRTTCVTLKPTTHHTSRPDGRSWLVMMAVKLSRHRQPSAKKIN